VAKTDLFLAWTACGDGTHGRLAIQLRMPIRRVLLGPSAIIVVPNELTVNRSHGTPICLEIGTNKVNYQIQFSFVALTEYTALYPVTESWFGGLFNETSKSDSLYFILTFMVCIRVGNAVRFTWFTTSRLNAVSNPSITLLRSVPVKEMDPPMWVGKDSKVYCSDRRLCEHRVALFDLFKISSKQRDES
jgi:hypothetical protein